MRIYLNAGFGEPLGGETLRLIAALGFKGVRQDVPAGRARDLVSEFSFSPLTPLFLVAGGKMPNGPDSYVNTASAVAVAMRDFGVGGAVEIGNEPDLTGYSPYEFAVLVRAAALAIWEVDPAIPVVAGGVMSTNERGLGYVEEYMATNILPPNVAIGYHTYRPTGYGPLEPNAGFHSRAAEFHRLRNIVGARNIWCTEIGWHDGEDKVSRGFPLCWLSKSVRHGEEDVARFLRQEIDLNRSAGAQVLTVFQLNDGPGKTPGDHYGIRRLDGTLKPSAHVARAR